ncbi:MAG: VWA domain-containing protein [Terracidiphilus sp.]
MNWRVRLWSAFVLGFPVFISCAHSGAQETQKPQEPPFSLEVNVNRLLVPVVVRDSKGHTVDDLKKEDFQVLDRGKPHPISGFTVQHRGVLVTATADSTESGQPHPALAAAPPQTPATPRRFIVFLFDDMNLQFADLERTQKAGEKAMTEALADSDMAAVVSTSGQITSPLTQDRAKLQAAVMKLRPLGLHRLEVGDNCIQIDYYEADQILNNTSGGALKEAQQQWLKCHVMVDPHNTSCPDLYSSNADMTNCPGVKEVNEIARQALAAGQQNVKATYTTIEAYVRRMATLPGQRSLILVSPGMLTIDDVGRIAESDLMNFADASNVTISAIDGRGLYSSALSADERTMTVSALLDEFHRAEVQDAGLSLASLAAATGGNFFHNSNDMDAGFKNVIELPESVYVLELSLDSVKPDGIYHRLDVKVDREALQVQARPGYFLPKPQKTRK